MDRDRAEVLRRELQQQKARILKENQDRAQRAKEAYSAVESLNFLGYSPKDLQLHIPTPFLRGAYSQHRLPSVNFPPPPPQIQLQTPTRTASSLPNASTATSASPTGASMAGKTRKRKRHSNDWNNSDATNSSNIPIIPVGGTSNIKGEHSAPPISKETEKQIAELKAFISQVHIDIKQNENHIKQLSQVYDKQRQLIDEKKAQLQVTIRMREDAAAQLSKVSLQRVKLTELAQSAQVIPQKANARTPPVAPQTPPKSQSSPPGPSPRKVLEHSSNIQVAASDQSRDIKVSGSSNAYQLESPLAQMNSYRINPYFVGSSPNRVYSRTYNSSFVKDSEICETELNGAKCIADVCEYVHFRDFDIPKQQILAHILKNYTSSTFRKEYANELKKLGDPDSERSIKLLFDMLNP